MALGYSPFPQEEPSGQAAPMQSLDTPGESFGAGVAESAGKFGATLEDIGQRQFAQAVKFQEMKNETWANETVTSFGNELADAQEQFRELQGLNRVNALPEYQKRVDEIHQKYAQGAPSPNARLNFLTQSRGFVVRAHESFGTLAGTAADEAHNQAAEGAIKTAQASAVQNWGTANIAGAITDIVTKTAQQGQIRGWDKPKVDSEVQKNVGLVYKQIASAKLATGDTAGARALLDQAAAEKIPGTDLTIIDGADHLAMIERVEQKEHWEEGRADEKRRQAEADARRAKEEAAEAADKKYVSQILLHPEKVNIDQIGNDPFLTGPQMWSLRNMLNERLKQEEGGGPSADDGSLKQRLFERIHLPDGDPNKITGADQLNQYFGHGINKTATLDWLRGEVALRKTPEGAAESDMKKGVLDLARRILVRKDPLRPDLDDPTDVVGFNQFLKFQSFFEGQYIDGRQAGRSPTQLLTDGEKDYLGKYIQQYLKTPEEKSALAASLLQQSTGAPPLPSWRMIKNSPFTGKQIPFTGGAAPAAPTAPPAGPPKRAANESASEYLRRRGL